MIIINLQKNLSHLFFKCILFIFEVIMLNPQINSQGTLLNALKAQLYSKK